MKRVAIGILLVLLTTPALGAQGPGFDQIPTIGRVPRDSAAEAARLAVLGPGAKVHVWRFAGSVEHVFRMYRNSLDAVEAWVPPDSARPSTAGDSRVTFYVNWHTFDDECVDTAIAPLSQSSQTCQRWRRGRDKIRTLQIRTTTAPRQYVDQATFTWFRREATGLARLRVEIRDLGLSQDWKSYTPLLQLSIESVPLALETGAASAP
jgi:hypothetical protein